MSRMFTAQDEDYIVTLDHDEQASANEDDSKELDRVFQAIMRSK